MHSKDGRHVELLLNAASRRNAAGQIVGVTGVGQDITEKKYIEKAQINAAKMRASNDAKGNFLASMSHEMRTPLNGVLGTRTRTRTRTLTLTLTLILTLTLTLTLI